MNIQAILHIPQSNFAFPYTRDTLCVRFKTAKDDFTKISIIYGDKYSWDKRKNLEMTRIFQTELFDYYEGYIKLKATRFGYIFKLENSEGTFYYSEDGFSKDYDFEHGYYSMFHFPFINPDVLHTVPLWAKKAVFYQIFVERFFNGNSSNPAKKLTGSWGDLPTSKSFFGGDLKGITEKIPYLKELGINAIYLTPIFKSPSNHKYDTIDYLEIDEAFGTKEEFKELVEKLHKNNIKIVLDAVFNHSGFLFKPFQDVIEKGEKSKYASWFHVSSYPVNLDPKHLNYKTFGSVREMPKLNTLDEGLRKYLLKVATYWVENFDIDGWRLDVSDEISPDFWRDFRKAVKKVKPSLLIIGETWHNSYSYLQGDQFDSVMNYPVTKECLYYFAQKTINAKTFSNNLIEILMRNTTQVNNVLLNLLDSHDTFRFLTLCNGNIELFKNAVTFLLTYTGIPCIYYGSEIGTLGNYDPDCRRVFNWNKDEWNTDLREFYKTLIKIKKTTPSLNGSNVKFLSTENLFIMKRTSKEKTIYIVINNTTKNQKLDLNISEGIELLSNKKLDLTKSIIIPKESRLIIETIDKL